MKLLIKTKHHLREFSDFTFARKYKNYLDTKNLKYKQYEVDENFDCGLRGIEGARMTREQLMEGLVL